MQALRTAATGMAAQQLNVEVISNNIANMNTVAFKKQRAEFQDLLYQTLEQAGAQSSDQGTIVPTGVQIGAGVRAGSVYRINTQGTTTATGTMGAIDLGNKEVRGLRRVTVTNHAGQSVGVVEYAEIDSAAMLENDNRVAEEFDAKQFVHQQLATK